MEWLDPIYCSGHWVSEMVKIAGGVDQLGREGADSVRISWDDVVKWAPNQDARKLRELFRVNRDAMRTGIPFVLCPWVGFENLGPPVRFPFPRLRQRRVVVVQTDNPDAYVKEIDRGRASSS